MTNQFSQKVYQIAKKIPPGKVATYGQLARLAGKPKAARAVGFLMKNNPDIKNIPCYKVVASDGRLCGYSASGGLKKKKQKLVSDGVVFKGNRVDLSRSRWDPAS